MRSHQRGALILLGLLSIALASVVVLSPSRRPVEALSATNACRSSATGTFSDISVSLSGTATPSAATVGTDTITLSGVSFQAAVPATLLIAGYNLRLLNLGDNSIPVLGWVGIQGANTVEGVQTKEFSTSVTTTIADPDGLRGTGDETATPLSLNLGLGDSTWTPTGGDVQFAQAPPGTLATIPAGQADSVAVKPIGGVYISAQVANGLVKANFDCQGGTSAATGTSFSASTPGPFATVTVTGGTPPSSTSSTTSTVATTVPATTATPTTAPATTAAATSTSAAPAPGPVSGSASYTASCKNSATPDLSELKFEATGTAPGQVRADSAFGLSKMKWRVTIPASVFQFGLNLHLITPGTPVVGGIDLAINGSNTVQATQDSPKIPLTVPVTVGADGLALPSVVDFDVPDLAWTARTGRMDFTMYGANVTVTVGAAAIQVVFVCKPSSGGPFVSSTAVGVSNATTTTAKVSSGAAVPTTAVGAESLVRTGPSGSLIVQILLGLVLLDLGYLTLSLRRTPRRHRRR